MYISYAESIQDIPKKGDLVVAAVVVVVVVTCEAAVVFPPPPPEQDAALRTVASNSKTAFLELLPGIGM
jgi:hypothetical protein